MLSDIPVDKLGLFFKLNSPKRCIDKQHYKQNKKEVLNIKDTTTIHFPIDSDITLKENKELNHMELTIVIP